MSEEQKKRGIPEIQQDYQGLALKAGHTQYQIFTLERDLELMNQTMRDLNIEASKVQQAEAVEVAAALEAKEGAK